MGATWKQYGTGLGQPKSLCWSGGPKRWGEKELLTIQTWALYLPGYVRGEVSESVKLFGLCKQAGKFLVLLCCGGGALRLHPLILAPAVDAATARELPGAKPCRLDTLGKSQSCRHHPCAGSTELPERLFPSSIILTPLYSSLAPGLVNC